MCKERIKLKKISFWEKLFNFFHNSKKFLIVTFLDEFDPVLFIYALKSDPRGLTEVLYKYKQPSFDGLAGVFTCCNPMVVGSSYGLIRKKI